MRWLRGNVVLKLSLLVWVSIVLAHLVTGTSVFGSSYISELKHRPMPAFGEAVFVSLLGLLGYLVWAVAQTRCWSWCWYYGGIALLVLGLLVTPAYATVHILLYVLTLVFGMAGYLVYLVKRNGMRDFLAFVGVLILIVTCFGSLGGPILQKALLTFFLVLINLHYIAIRDAFDDRTPEQQRLLAAARAGELRQIATAALPDRQGERST